MIKFRQSCGDILVCKCVLMRTNCISQYERRSAHQNILRCEGGTWARHKRKLVWSILSVTSSVFYWHPTTLKTICVNGQVPRSTQWQKYRQMHQWPLWQLHWKHTCSVPQIYTQVYTCRLYNIKEIKGHLLN